MGKQTARLIYKGKDHKDIFYQGNYHTALYYGKEGGYIWRKLNMPDDGNVSIYDVLLTNKNKWTGTRYWEQGFCVADSYGSISIKSAYSADSGYSFYNGRITQGNTHSIVYGIDASNVSVIYLTKDGRNWKRKTLVNSSGYASTETNHVCSVSVFDNGFATTKAIYRIDENLNVSVIARPSADLTYAQGIATSHTFGFDSLGNVYKITLSGYTKILEGYNASNAIMKNGNLYLGIGLSIDSNFYTTIWNDEAGTIEKHLVDYYGKIYITKEQKFIAYTDEYSAVGAGVWESDDTITWTKKGVPKTITPLKAIGSAEATPIAHIGFEPYIDCFGRFTDTGGYKGYASYYVRKGDTTYFFNDPYFNDNSCAYVFNPNEYGINSNYNE